MAYPQDVVPAHLEYPKLVECPSCKGPLWLHHEGARRAPCHSCVRRGCNRCGGTGRDGGNACSWCSSVGVA